MISSWNFSKIISPGVYLISSVTDFSSFRSLFTFSENPTFFVSSRFQFIREPICILNDYSYCIGKVPFRFPSHT